MFEPVKLVLNSIIQWWTMITDTMLNRMGFVGISVIGIIILGKLINVWRKAKG